MPVPFLVERAVGNIGGNVQVNARWSRSRGHVEGGSPQHVEVTADRSGLRSADARHRAVCRERARSGRNVRTRIQQDRPHRVGESVEIQRGGVGQRESGRGGQCTSGPQLQRAVADGRAAGVGVRVGQQQRPGVSLPQVAGAVDDAADRQRRAAENTEDTVSRPGQRDVAVDRGGRERTYQAATGDGDGVARVGETTAGSVHQARGNRNRAGERARSGEGQQAVAVAAVIAGVAVSGQGQRPGTVDDRGDRGDVPSSRSKAGRVDRPARRADGEDPVVDQGGNGSGPGELQRAAVEREPPAGSPRFASAAMLRTPVDSIVAARVVIVSRQPQCAGAVLGQRAVGNIGGNVQVNPRWSRSRGHVEGGSPQHVEVTADRRGLRPAEARHRAVRRERARPGRNVCTRIQQDRPHRVGESVEIQRGGVGQREGGRGGQCTSGPQLQRAVADGRAAGVGVRVGQQQRPGVSLPQVAGAVDDAADRQRRAAENTEDTVSRPGQRDVAVDRGGRERTYQAATGDGDGVARVGETTAGSVHQPRGNRNRAGERARSGEGQQAVAVAAVIAGVAVSGQGQRPGTADDRGDRGDVPSSRSKAGRVDRPARRADGEDPVMDQGGNGSGPGELQRAAVKHKAPRSRAEVVVGGDAQDTGRNGRAADVEIGARKGQCAGAVLGERACAAGDGAADRRKSRAADHDASVADALFIDDGVRADDQSGAGAEGGVVSDRKSGRGNSRLPLPMLAKLIVLVVVTPLPTVMKLHAGQRLAAVGGEVVIVGNVSKRERCGLNCSEY